MAKANAAIENNHEQSMLEQPQELTALHQQHLLHTLAANIPGTAVFVVDANLRYRLADGPALRDAGMTSADFEGKTIFEALDPDLARAYEPNYRQALAGQSFQLEHHSHDRDYITQGTPLRNAAGEVYAAMAVSHDITERKRTERNVTFLAEISDEVVSLSNPDEIMARVGERIAGYLGLSRCNFSIVELEADRITAIYDWRRDAGAPSVMGEHRISTFLTEQGKRHYATGQMAVVNDSRHHPMMNATPDMLRMLHIGSVVDAPYLQQGQWKFLLSACRFEPCVWRDDEVALIHELAARIYLRIERARAEAALKTLNEQLEQRVFERTEALRQSHEQLRELSAHMEMTREDERTRIAREVHDELGGHLTALKIDLGALTWGRDADAVLVERVNDLKAHIDEIVTIVRRIGSDLRPPVLDDYGLIPALEWHGREFERRTGIPCFLDLMDNKPPLNREKRTAVFRVFQEALTNVARHADATKVNVTMGVDDGHLVLVIEDDGIGLQMDELDFNHSLGLKGMQERMNEVGGVVEIDSEAGRGVVVAIRVPV